MKVGRNDPCPCGSGLKYKNCHLKPAQSNASIDLLWQRQHELNQRLPSDLLRFVETTRGSIVLDQAWKDFTLGKEMKFDQQSTQLTIFMPWFFYEWRPADGQDFPAASAYLRRRGRYLEALATRYLEAGLDAALSFFEVIDVEHGSRLTLRDTLSGVEVVVVEKTASQTLQRGDIILARVVELSGLAVLDGCAPIALPPIEKGQLIDLRNQMLERHRTVTTRVLRAHAREILEIYHSTVARLMNPKLPKLSNTDGEPLAFCRVTYQIPSPRQAFEALSHLSLGYTQGELLKSARLDDGGNILSVELPWLKRVGKRMLGGNTTLGSITIDGKRLVAEVNSEERAKRFRRVADRVLPEGSRHLSTVIESAEVALETYRHEHRQRRSEVDDLNDRPEVKDLLRQHLMDYYRRWPDMDIPALGGQTPRQAVKTNDGREMVEALLLDLERRETGPSGVTREIVAALRTSLGFR